MAGHMSVEVSVIISQRIRGRLKRKHVQLFTLKDMTFEQYRAASDILIAGITPIGQRFLDERYTMEPRGEPIDKVCD